MKNKAIVSKILVHAQKIQDYCADSDYNSFCNNDILVEACVFNLSQIGELAGKLDESFRLLNTSIQWNQIRGLRNRIVHDYEGVNRQLIWEIVQDDIGNLIIELQNLSDNNAITDLP